MSVPKWTEERTNTLTSSVDAGTTITKEQVATLAEELETTTRSIASKLRKLGYDVETASAAAAKFSAEETQKLAEFVVDNSGKFTYAEIAENFPEFSAKQIQGKLLSLELSSHVKPAVKIEAEKKYTEEECDKIVSMAKEGAFLENIAQALNKPIASIRGKALSLMRQEILDSIPKQRETKPAGVKADALADVDVASLTVEQIAEAIGKTTRGVRTMLTRRGLVCQDYDGAAKREKAEAAA